MARPWKHPKTGVYWFRKAVPAHLRKLVGKREEKVSLETKDPGRAKLLHMQKAVEVEERWARLAAGPRRLGRRQVEALAGEAYRAVVASSAEVADNLNSLPRLGVVGKLARDKSLLTGEWDGDEDSSGDIEADREARYGGLVDRILAKHGLQIDAESRRALLARVVNAAVEARRRVLDEMDGNYRPEPGGERFPAFELDPAAAKVSMGDLWDRYVAEAKPTGSTIKRWRPCIDSFIAHVGTTDVSLIKPEQIVSWKEALIDRKLHPLTIRDAYFASVKAVLNWAVRNFKIARNPMEGIGIAIPKRETARTARRGLTPNEAKIILEATLAPVSPRMSKERAAAQRWVPWLCAYTGARVNEITQLRGADVCRVEGVWAIRITPEAGSTKTGEERTIPLHPHLLDQGFVGFAKACGDGPLFYEPARLKVLRPGDRPSVRVGQRLAEWVRSLGVSDERVDPNHGWRHAFKTLSRRSGLTPEEARAIQGHAPQSEGEKYGRFDIDTLSLAVEDLPYFPVEAPIVNDPWRDAPDPVRGLGARAASTITPKRPPVARGVVKRRRTQQNLHPQCPEPAGATGPESMDEREKAS
ncbi:MAG: site-specific integrase [Methylacidiphilales bacterium]|nr:site-specific integrase [Candidatus Methylacidiphilales bacterium]